MQRNSSIVVMKVQGAVRKRRRKRAYCHLNNHCPHPQMVGLMGSKCSAILGGQLSVDLLFVHKVWNNDNDPYHTPSVLDMEA